VKPTIVNVLFDIPKRPPADALAVHGATASGLPLMASAGDVLGADVLWVPPLHSFPVHAHPGDHLLLCIDGEGSISIDRETYIVRPGDLYLIPGNVPHAVGATERGHVLVSIGAPHKAVDSPERMVPTDWHGTRVMVPMHADGGPMCLCGAGEASDEHSIECPRRPTVRRPG
jgi:quercetin dioxygenase-like cupin family protein